MSSERDDGSGRDDDERPKLSWSEIDKRRDGVAGRREERGPRGRVQQERARAAARQYVDKIEGQLFSEHGSGAHGDELVRALRDAHGTPGLARACRDLLEQVGTPRDPSLLSLFLDAGEPELVLAGCEGLERLREAGELDCRAGLRTQLRMLAEDANDDVAYAAEELLAKLA